MTSMPDDEPFLIIDSSKFVVRARPRLEGTDNRRPDASKTSFQDRLIRSVVDVPHEPFTSCSVTVDVPDDDHLPMVATLKSVLDSLQQAKVVDDDRHVRSARIRKYQLVGDALPVVNVEILPRHEGATGFIRDFSKDGSKVVRAVTEAVPYSYRSGIPGPVSFTNRWASNADEYEDVLRQQWQDLQHEGAVTAIGSMAHFLLPARLLIHLPVTLTEDADNAVLYVIDMLELVLRDALEGDTGGKTLDQLLVEVGFVRDRISGLGVTAIPTERLDQYFIAPYYIKPGEGVDPFDPESS